MEKQVNEERMEHVLYHRGGWKLEGIFESRRNEELKLFLELPFEIGTIYFQRVEELGSEEFDLEHNKWRFHMDEENSSVAVLNSDGLPRDLKDLLLEVGWFMKNRESIEKTLGEWLEEEGYNE